MRRNKSKHVGQIDGIGHQSAGLHEISERIACRKVLCRQQLHQDLTQGEMLTLIGDHDCSRFATLYRLEAALIGFL
ncbi:hypothetical protein C7G42_29520 [Bradyrhizobium sp. MOS003]|nr:hypothetical protein C7G42_29520 [Bradyrhizobium sp. MOS003]